MINVVCGIRSTGRICTDLAKSLEAQGHEVKIAYGRETVPTEFEKYAVRIGNDWDVRFHGLKARLFDGMGFGSRRATKNFIRWIEEYNPDVIHLHNIHGYYLNVRILFDYLRKCDKKIIWTMHDCWSFTGHCMYFDYENCDGWKHGCGNCPQKSVYPKRIGIDHSKRNYRVKKELFTGIKNLTIVTPSQWLAELVKQSYMRKYDVKVIHNGVDTDVFKPTESQIRCSYGLADKTVILGVAAVWDRRKGLEDFIELSKRLDESYKIILVGLTKDQMSDLPSNIIGIERTNSVQDLVKLYSAADVFVNPTKEDNYPTTNLEAIACGTPVVTYNTGGSPESANIYGVTLRNNSVEDIIESLRFINTLKKKDVDISKEATIRGYLEIYNEA